MADHGLEVEQEQTCAADAVIEEAHETILDFYGGIMSELRTDSEGAGQVVGSVIGVAENFLLDHVLVNSGTMRDVELDAPLPAYDQSEGFGGRLSPTQWAALSRGSSGSEPDPQAVTLGRLSGPEEGDMSPVIMSQFGEADSEEDSEEDFEEDSEEAAVVRGRRQLNLSRRHVSNPQAGKRVSFKGEKGKVSWNRCSQRELCEEAYNLVGSLRASDRGDEGPGAGGTVATISRTLGRHVIAAVCQRYGDKGRVVCIVDFDPPPRARGRTGGHSSSICVATSLTICGGEGGDAATGNGTLRRVCSCDESANVLADDKSSACCHANLYRDLETSSG